MLDAGRLKEFEAPYILLKNPRSLFAQLVEQTGPAEARRLYEIAREKYHEQRAAIPETMAEDNNTTPQRPPEISVTPETEADDNDSAPLLQPETPAAQVDDHFSSTQQPKLPKKGNNSDSPPEQKPENPENDSPSQQQPEAEDDGGSQPSLHQQIDVEIKPDKQNDSTASDKESSSAWDGIAACFGQYVFTESVSDVHGIRDCFAIGFNWRWQSWIVLTFVYNFI